MVRLIEAEYWVNNTVLGRILRTDALSERLARGATVGPLRITEVHPSRHQVMLRGEHRMYAQAGDDIIVHRGDLIREDILCGRVKEVTADTLVLETDAAEAAAQLPPHGWVIDKKPFRSGLRVAHRALSAMMMCRDIQRLRLLLTTIPPAPPPQEVLDQATVGAEPFIGTLNTAQFAAAQLALAAPPATLVQGPPGTGKTHVIAALVRAFVARGEKILLAAGTNTAVNNILRALARGRGGTEPFTDFLRIGHIENAPADLVDALEDAQVDPARRFTQTFSRLAIDLTTLRKHCLEASVVATTTYRAVTHDVFHILGRDKFDGDVKRAPLGVYGPLFDVVILDEAGQLNEPMALAAINHARRFILVGDHRQLPPIVPEEVSARVQPERWLDGTCVSDIGLRGLDRSLFERLIDRAPLVMLTRQYRMHADIMRLSSELFYNGRLEADASCAARTLALSQTHLDALPHHARLALEPNKPVIFIDCPGHGPGRHNDAEIDVVRSMIHHLLHGPEPLQPKQIGVISPFRAQVFKLRAELRHALGDERGGAIDVDTVDRFQGGERDVILVSFVKTHKVSEFLTDTRRLNVTLTRARCKMILIGDADTLTQHPLYRTLLHQPQVHWLRWDLTTASAHPSSRTPPIGHVLESDTPRP